ncbi:MAG: single-stranded-DNA-specific exonuclease RecJ [bacterium]
MPVKQYIVRPQKTLISGAEMPSLLQELLGIRELTDAHEIAAFLQPDYEAHTHDPYLLKDMEKAVTRIIGAMKANEKVVVYSDYDTDGIPGGVLFHDFFKKAGFTNFINYIPHRHDEGFGLNSDAVEQFIADGVKLLITIDCGIADIVPVTEATAAGMDVIITDHHLPGKIIPPAYAIINPKQADCMYPEKMLCGSGVAFKLIQGILTKDRFDIKEGQEKWWLDMVGIATLSDMVPLRGENRVFAHFGMTVLRRSPRLGLMKLLRQAKVDQRYLTEEDIGFTIGPRINAASRMGVPMDAFRLLATQDVDEADTFATHLNAINNERKGTVAALVKEVKKILTERYGTGKDAHIPKVIVLGNPEWKPSLLGLVANTVAEEYNCPVYLWGRDGDGVLKGSCRSDGYTDLVALMQEVQDASLVPGAAIAGLAAAPVPAFIQFGGHAMSGGFAVAHAQVHTLQEQFDRAVDRLAKVQKGSPEILIDKELTLADVNWGTWSTIEKLAPFGVGNPKPLFMFRNVSPTQVKQFGKEKNHLELIFENRAEDYFANHMRVPAIGFFCTVADWKESLDRDVVPNEPVTLIATMEKSMFGGRKELRLRIVDIIKT